MNDPRKATLLTALGAIVLSPDALALRWISADALHIVSWRGLLMAGGMGLLLWLRYRAALPAVLRRCGWTGLGCALSYCASTLCFLQAMMLAGAASTLMIYSVSPLVAGVLSWIWLGERLSARSLVAIAVCALGIALIVADDAPGADLGGNLFALAAAVLLALNFTLARSRPCTDMSPALMLGALLASALARVLGGPPELANEELVVLALMALFVLPLGFMLVQLGPRSIGAAEVGLLLLLEIILGPLWVWLVLDEAPTPAVLGGGAIVLLALVGHGLLGWREQGRATSARAVRRAPDSA